jgi:AraC family L-rhamnose operon regulatory protein RhaS
MSSGGVFQDSPLVKNGSPVAPTFNDLDAVYFPDNCAPLTAAAEAGRVQLSALARGHYPGSPLRPHEAPGLRTAGLWDAPQQQDWGLDWHRNEGIEITYLARGSLDFAVDQREWVLRSGQLTITRPWQRHRVGNPNIGPSRLHWCIVDVGVRRPNQQWIWPDWVSLSDDDLRRLTELLKHNEDPVWPAGRDVDDTFEEMARCVMRPEQRTRDSRLRQLVSRLLLDVLETLEKQRVALDEKLSSARRSVQLFLADLDNCIEHDWTLAEMASSCELGRTRFAQYCQEITNMSPTEYLTSLRMRRAAELLRDAPDLNITDIAFRCGYESSQYFSAAFAKYHKLSPRAFRSGLRSVGGVGDTA